MALSQTARIRAVFFLHAISSGGLYSRLPSIQRDLGLDFGTLGLVLSGLTAGSILTFFFVSRLIEGFGPRRVLAATIPFMGLGTALIAAMPSGPALFAYLIFYGVLYSLPNAAMNIEADRVEAAAGRRVMNSCHGLWSIGYLLATLLGTLAVALQLPPLWHFGLLAIPLLGIGLWMTLGIDPAPARAHAATQVRRFALPTLAIVLLVAFAIGPNLLEGGLRNWSVIYMRDSFGAPGWVDTLTLPVFLIAQAAGRLRADGWVTRFGPVRTARVLTAIAATGCVLVVLAPHLIVALLGFLLIGVGVCTTYPLTTSAATRLGDRPASQNVAALTLVNQLVQLGAPPLLGAIANHAGIRAVFTVALPFVVASVWLARSLNRHR